MVCTYFKLHRGKFLNANKLSPLSDKVTNVTYCNTVTVNIIILSLTEDLFSHINEICIFKYI
jgi:hypothetical protein